MGAAVFVDDVLDQNDHVVDNDNHDNHDHNVKYSNNNTDMNNAQG